jgi:hypothetical protein
MHPRILWRSWYSGTTKNLSRAAMVAAITIGSNREQVSFALSETTFPFRFGYGRKEKEVLRLRVKRNATSPSSVGFVQIEADLPQTTQKRNFLEWLFNAHYTALWISMTECLSVGALGHPNSTLWPGCLGLCGPAVQQFPSYDKQKVQFLGRFRHFGPNLHKSYASAQRRCLFREKRR